MRNFSFISILLITSALASQNPGGVPGETIWNRTANNDSLINMSSPPNYNKFNFNPKIEITNDSLVYQNHIEEFYSLFMVFKSDTLSESTIFEIESGNNTTKMTNEKMYKGNEIDFNKSRVKRGIILSYLTREIDFSRKNKFSFEEFSMLMNTDGINNQLLEIVYYPRYVSKIEKEKVETYLSVKYGISLEGEKNYINSSNDTIWNYEKNVDFNYRVTGFGRDSLSNLSQLQSGNAEPDGVYFQYRPLDSINPNIPDKTFLLWGDNNGNTHIEIDTSLTSDYNKMKRVWKTQITSNGQQDTLKTHLYFDLKNLDIGPNLSLIDSLVWLARSNSFNNHFNYYNAEYIKQTKVVDSIIYFENISWDLEPAYFTLVSNKEIFVVFETEPEICSQDNLGKLKFKIVGGEPPYKVAFSNGEKRYEMTVDSNIGEMFVNTGESTFNVIDNTSKTVTQKVYIEPKAEEDLPVLLAEKWILDNNGETTIFPQINKNGPHQENLKFEWYRNDELLNQGNQFNISEPGEYSLIVKSKEGCYKELPFIVEKNSDILSSIHIYPNPSESNENFQISYNLDKISDLQLKIYNVTGQLIKEKRIDNTQGGSIQERLKTSGSYLITIETYDGVHSFKIIIK